MKNIYLLFTATLIVSCATKSQLNLKDVKSVKVTSKEDRSVLYFKDYTPKKISRKIASIKKIDEQMSDANSYFFSLYSQYRTINKLTHTKDELNICPQFHNEIIISKIKNSSVTAHDNINYRKFQSTPYSVITHPSLALNYKNEKVFEYLSEKGLWANAKEVVKSALIEHNQLNLLELKSLCESGFSEGFYAYKNMVSYYSSNTFAFSKKSMPAFLKIPVLANMLILHNFTDGINNYEDNVITSLNISWFKSYLDDLKSEVDDEKKYLSLR